MTEFTRLATVFFAIVAGPEITSADGPQIQSRASLEFRRLFVPETRVDQVIRGEQYIPYKSIVFEQLVDDLKRSTTERPPQVLATAGSYTARFDGQSLVDGTARLKLQQASDGTAQFSLDECNLAIAELTGDETEAASAQLGTTSDGTRLLLVDKSNAVSFSWSSRGEVQSNGDVIFSLTLPNSTSSQLDLQVPSDWIPTSPNAIVSEHHAGDQPATRVWRFFVDSSARVVIRMIRPNAESNRRSTALVRHQNLTYSFEKAVVRLLAEVKFDVDSRPIDQLDFRAAAALRIRSVRLGESELNFVVSRRTEDETTISVEFPEPVSGIDRKLVVEAVTPPVFERPWRLPSLVAEDTRWQEGRTVLEFVTPISLDHLNLDQCVQTSVKRLLDPAGKVVELQQLVPEASATVILGRDANWASYVGGTVLKLHDDQLDASCVFDFASTRSDVFELPLEVARPWIVDSIQAVALVANDSSTTEAAGTKIPVQWEVRTADEDKQTLAVSLSSAVRPQRGVQIQLHAHRPRPQPGSALPIAQMRVAVPRDVEQEQHLIALYGDGPHRFELQSDDEIAWFDPSAADLRQRAVLLTEPGGLYFQAPFDSQEIEAYLTESVSRFKAVLSASTEVNRDFLDETFRLRCEPASLIRKMRVALTRPGDEDISWSLEGDGERGIVAHKISVEPPQSENGASPERPPASEVWELTLNRSRAVPFTIVGRRRSKTRDGVSASLVWMPDASSQEGTLLLSSGDGTQFKVEHTGLTPFPLPTVPFGRFTGARAAYRYRPADPPQVRIIWRGDNDETVSAWAWSCHLESRIAEGQSLHSATYRIENNGLNRVSLNLPNEAELRQVLVDSRVANVYLTGDSQIQFDLPAGVRYPTVVATFTVESKLPGFAGQIRPQIPDISIPVLRSLWTIWLPPDADSTIRTKVSPAPETRSLAKRLLGPLLREPNQTPFKFGDFASMWNGMIGNAEQESKERAWRVLNAFSAVQKDAASWAQLFQAYEKLAQDTEARLPPLFIDSQSFERLGITAPDSLPSPQSERFEHVLDRTGLSLLVSQGQAALVSQRFLSSHRESIRATDHPLAWTSHESSKLEDLPLIPAGQWTDAAARPSPWSVLDHSVDSELFRTGWISIELELVPGEESAVQLLRPSRLLVVAWSGFIFAVGLGWWLTVKKPKPLFVAGLLIAAAAALVPAPFSTIATGLFLGLPVGAVIGVVSGSILLVRPKIAPLPIQESAVSRLSSVSTSILLVAAGCYFLWAIPGFSDDAAEPEQTASSSKRPKIHSVVIPIDKERRPSGDIVYVPRELYESLLNLTAKRKTLTNAWLLRKAEYDLMLNWRGFATELGASELVATFDLEVQGNNTKVVLPLSRDQLHIIADRAMLNGEAVQVDWATDGSGLTFDVGETGSHMLELALRPVTRTDGQFIGTSISIPQVHSSTVRVHLPDSAAGVSILNALGNVSRDADTGAVTAELGPIDRLALRWPRSGTDNSITSRSASQISWLTIGQGSVVMRSKFRFTANGGTLDQVAIRTDPRLQMRLVPEQPVELVKEEITDGGTTRIATFRVTGSPASEFLLDMMFAVPDTSGVGRISVPRAEPVAGVAASHLLAVSLSSRLQLVEPLPDALETISAADFLDLWGSREPDQARPDVALRLSDSASQVLFGVSPTAVSANATETLQIALGLGTADLRYRAQIESSAGSLFHARLRISKNLRVTHVQLESGGELLPISWKRVTEDVVVISAQRPLPAFFTLLLTAEATVADERDLDLPTVGLEEIPASAKRIEVYRHHSITVRLRPGKSWREIASGRTGRLEPGLGRLVSVLEPTVGSRPGGNLLQAVIQRNDPSPKYQLAIAANRVDGQWWAEVACRLYDFQGLVDTVRFEVPSSWDVPIEVDSGRALRVTSPGSDRSQLLIQPSSPLASGAVVRFRGRLVDSPIELPDIRVLDRQADPIDRFVALQTESANQKTEWLVPGLREATWPTAIAEQVALPEGQHQFYRVVGPRFRARIGTMGPVAGVPQVRLVDIHINQGWNNYSCVASFDIEPAGLEVFTFQLPVAARLLHVFVADQSALTSAGDHNLWEVRLTHRQLPQRIELLYTGLWPADADDPEPPVSIALPQILDVPVERTLVTLTGGDNSRWELQGAEVSALRQERFRLRSMTSLIDLSRTVARDQILVDRQRWYSPWAQRIVASQRMIDGYRRNEAQSDETLDAELSEIVTSQQEAAEDLQTAALLHEELRSTVTRAGLVGAEEAARLSPAMSSRIVAKGQLQEVKVSPVPPTGELPNWQRLLVVAALFATCGVLYFLYTRGPLRELIVQWLFAFGVIVGVFWWLYLTPSIAGWLIVVVSVLAALRGHGIRVSGTRRGQPAV